MSPECRDLTFAQVASIGEEEAYQTFLRFRWPDTDGKPTCRHCGVIDCYEVRGRKFKCSGCRREFSVTSGTVFAFRKLPFARMLTAIWLSVNAAKGLAALHLSRLVGTQFKTAWVPLMKLREAVGYRREGMVLGGEVQMDGKPHCIFASSNGKALTVREWDERKRLFYKIDNPVDFAIKTGSVRRYVLLGRPMSEDEWALDERVVAMRQGSAIIPR